MKEIIENYLPEILACVVTLLGGTTFLTTAKGIIDLVKKLIGEFFDSEEFKGVFALIKPMLEELNVTNEKIDKIVYNYEELKKKIENGLDVEEYKAIMEKLEKIVEENENLKRQNALIAKEIRDVRKNEEAKA